MNNLDPDISSCETIELNAEYIDQEKNSDKSSSNSLEEVPETIKKSNTIATDVILKKRQFYSQVRLKKFNSFPNSASEEEKNIEKEDDIAEYSFLYDLLFALNLNSKKLKLKIKNDDLITAPRKNKNSQNTGSSENSQKAILTLFQRINLLRKHKHVTIEKTKELFDAFCRNNWVHSVINNQKKVFEKHQDLITLINTKIFIGKLDENIKTEREKLKHRKRSSQDLDLELQEIEDLSRGISSGRNLIQKLNQLKANIEHLEDHELLDLLRKQHKSEVDLAEIAIQDTIDEANRLTELFQKHGESLIGQLFKKPCQSQMEQSCQDEKKSDLTKLLKSTLFICKESIEEVNQRKEFPILWGHLESENFKAPVRSLDIINKVTIPIRRITAETFPNFIEKVHREFLRPNGQLIPEELHGAYERRGSHPNFYMEKAYEFLRKSNKEEKS